MPTSSNASGNAPVPPWVWVGLLLVPPALFLLGVLTWAAWHVVYWDRIYPGVHVAGVDLSGLTRQEAEARLRRAFPYPEEGRITLTWQDRTWTYRPVELGFVIDYASVAEAAWQVGRTGHLLERIRSRWRAWRHGVNLPLPAVFHQAWAYARITNDMVPYIGRPPQEARLWLEGTQVRYEPGRAGRAVDWDRLLPQLARNMGLMRNARIDIPTVSVQPDILEAEDLARHLTRLLSAPLRLTLPDPAADDPGPWEVPPQQVAAMLRIEKAQDEQGRWQYVLRADPEPLRPFLKALAPQLLRLPVNARFTFDPETHTLHLLEPAVYGRRLNIPQTLEAVAQALRAGQHEVTLALDIQPPPVTDEARPEDLGIRELVAEHTTYFYGSSMARMRNIQIAGSRFHGYLVAPGEVFSMVALLGEISLDSGYQEAPIIFGDRTIRGVGGGVCQVSTTLFRTVFFGGYPVVERHPHSYRVYYYELTASGRVDPKWAGLDATVYVPLVDFKFKNDTPYWILMEVEVNIPHRYIRWRFYSTSDGRRVEWGTTGLRDRKPPPEPRYIENPELEPGEIRQTDWPIEGGTVTVWRQVFRGDQLLFEDTFTTRYQPWPAVCEYGPGTPGMPPSHPDPDDPCRPDPPTPTPTPPPTPTPTPAPVTPTPTPPPPTPTPTP